MRIFLASGNPGKVAELRALVATAGLPIEITSAAGVGGMPEVSEDTGTFEGNALKKARALRERLPAGAWSLADDAGLCVDALGGAPGVDSAYYAGPQGDSAANLAKLVARMRGVPEGLRGAHFVCVLALAGPDGSEHLFAGECPGRLADGPRGSGGFGYDPLFIPAGRDRTFGELGPEAKNALSHRARAWTRLAAWLKVNLPP